MRTAFRLSKSLTDDNYVHLVSLNPIAVFRIPDCICVSGDADPVLQKRAMEWYQNNGGNQIPIKRIIPQGYIEAIQKVRDNIELIDICQLSLSVGVREWDLARVLDEVRYNDIPYHFSFQIRKRFMDEVQKLLL